MEKLRAVIGSKEKLRPQLGKTITEGNELKANTYQCPVCYFHRQKFGAKSRLALTNHLKFSHMHDDLARYIVKLTVRERLDEQ